MEKGGDGRRRGEEKNLRLAYILTSLVYTTNRLLDSSPYYPYIYPIYAIEAVKWQTKSIG